MTKFVNGWQEREEFVLLGEDGSEHRHPCKYVGYFSRTLGDEYIDAISKDDRVISVDPEGDWLRVSWASGVWRPNVPNKRGGFGVWENHRETHCKTLESYGVQTFECDVPPIRRHLADNDVSIGRPRRAFLDLETDSRVPFARAVAGEARLLCWCLTDDAGADIRGTLAADTDEAELELVEQLWTTLEDYQQVVGWNLSGFDEPVLKERSKRLGIKRNHRRWLWLDHLVAFKKYNVSSAESGEEKQSYALNSIATQVLGEGKHDFEASKTWQAWVAGGEERVRLVEYCAQDVRLLPKIEAKTGYLELFQTICEVVGVFPDTRGISPSSQVDAFMLRLGRQRNYHHKTRWYDTETPTTKFKGAYVKKPTCNGIVKMVHVCDFSSLYPSVMISWNLSPETKLGPDATEGCLSPGTGLRTRNDAEGILPYALKKLLELRKQWKKKRASCAPGTPEAKDAERRSSAYKLVCNSFYGVIGLQYSRFYDRELAESTTQNGVWAIMRVNEAAEARGMTVVYTDTDGSYITGCTEDEFRAFVGWCNDELFPELMTGFGCLENRISLSYEKAFERITFVAAKKYTGTYLHYEGTRRNEHSKPETKGLEVRRGDSNRMARDLQAQVIETLDSGCELAEAYYKLVLEARRRVLEGPLELKDVVLSKSISKELGEYVVRTKADGSTYSPAHVSIARDIQNAGGEVGIGTRIPYVVFDASVSPAIVIPASEFVGQCDRYYLWEQRVYPPTLRLLEAAFPTEHWDDLERARPSRTYDPRQLEMFGVMGVYG